MKEIPYKCHVMVCVNDRGGERQSCADNGGKEIRAALKDAVKARGWTKPEVRVSQTLCQGLCSSGPNIMIYPQNIHYSGVTMDDIPVILEKIAQLLEN